MFSIKSLLQTGLAIPAHPLALDSNRKLDERRQRALSRYYIASGVGGLAVGVHTTQFEIRQPDIDLFEPILTIAAEEMSKADAQREKPLARIAGICGGTKQAIEEANLIKGLGYHAGLLSLAALKDENEDQLIEHCRQIAEIIPLFGFYLQPDVGGKVLSYEFWCKFCEIENVVAIKIAPFNRYRTLDVVRAVVSSGRDDITPYTGNDDNIVLDLISPFQFPLNGKNVEKRIAGGLLGHWSVWTQKAVSLLNDCHQAIKSSPKNLPVKLIIRNQQVTDCNAAFFDAANNYQGCIAGLHEVLRRQGLLEGIWCLNQNETLSPNQANEIDRVYNAYPHLNDDVFVQEHLSEWLSG